MLRLEEHPRITNLLLFLPGNSAEHLAGRKTSNICKRGCRATGGGKDCGQLRDHLDFSIPAQHKTAAWHDQRQLRLSTLPQMIKRITYAQRCVRCR